MERAAAKAAHMSAPDHALHQSRRFLLLLKGRPHMSQSFWRLRLVEHAGGICASAPEVADDPERPCREAEAPVQGRFQRPPLRSDADSAGGLLVSALSAQLP